MVFKNDFDYIVRMKKKLETDVLDLDNALEHANAANAETQKQIKKYQQSLRDLRKKNV